MTVKINCDFVGVVEQDAGHGPRQNGTSSIHDHNSHQHCDERAKFTQQGRSPSTRPNHTPHNYKENDSREYREVLVKRQQRQRIQQRTDGCQHRVRR